jgi:RNA polymerase-binding transcription factor DksA
VSSEKQERTSDLIDHATDTARVFLDASVSVVVSKLAPEQHHRFDGLHCVEEDCGVDLPAQRLTDGRVRCIDCQTRKEEATRRKL